MDELEDWFERLERKRRSAAGAAQRARGNVSELHPEDAPQTREEIIDAGRRKIYG
jgi:hypothetical protein